jgi:hypothetical protein
MRENPPKVTGCLNMQVNDLNITLMSRTDLSRPAGSAVRSAL